MSLETLFLLLMVLALFGGILSGLPVFLVLAGVPLLTAGMASLVGAFDLLLLQAFPQRIFGLGTNSLLIAVPLFVAMGVLLEQSGAAERMLLMLGRLLGGTRSGLAIAVLLVSTLVAASTGIIGATIVMLGLISLPAMLRAGLPVPLSSGLVCAAGTLGQIIPPSIVLILLGDQISNTWLEAQHASGNFAPEPVSVADLFAGALVPGLLLVLLYGVYVLIRLARPGVPSPAPADAEASPVDPEQDPEQDPEHYREEGPVTLGGVLTVFLPPLLLMLSVLGSILAGIATPTEAAAVGAVAALLLALSTRDARRWASAVALIGAVSALLLVALSNATAGPPTGMAWPAAIALVVVLLASVSSAGVVLWRDGVLQAVIESTVMVTAMVFGIILGASMLSLVFRGLGGDELIAGLLSQLPGGDWGALLLVMLVVFLLGFVLEFVEIIFIVIPLVGPVLLAGEFDPVWIGVLFAMNLQTSFLTPPFGFALFYFREVAPASLSTRGIYRAVWPFVLLQLLALLLVARFPALATWLPERLG